MTISDIEYAKHGKFMEYQIKNRLYPRIIKSFVFWDNVMNF